jgi:hypothetical protein
MEESKSNEIRKQRSDDSNFTLANSNRLTFGSTQRADNGKPDEGSDSDLLALRERQQS